MSLINDALKRASSAKTPPESPTTPEPPLQPVEHGRSFNLRLVLAPAVVAVLAVAGWFFFKGGQASGGSGSSSNRTPIVARETEAADLKDGKTAGNTSGVSNDISQQPLSQPNSAAALSPTNNTEPDKPTFPSLRLQGIFYRARNPSVMLNSKTVSVGDKIAGAKVVAITRDSVTLQWNGETKVLTLQ